jgi:hypothetical protein
VAWSSFLSVLIIIAWRVLFLHGKFTLWPFDGRTMRALAVVFAVAAGLWFLPHFGSPMLDIARRSILLTVVYWPLVQLLDIAPELGAQVRKIARGLR